MKKNNIVFVIGAKEPKVGLELKAWLLTNKEGKPELALLSKPLKKGYAGKITECSVIIPISHK